MSSVILLGAPGSGKGTIAENLKTSWKVAHISTGDMFREAVCERSEIGEKVDEYMKVGKLVPDDVTIEVVKERFSKSDVKKGFILDGFPRTIVQANVLKDILDSKKIKLDAVILLNVSAAVIIDRITGRRSCPTCARIYHLKNMPPRVDNKCDRCGTSPLVHRKDDIEEIVVDRLTAYNDQTAPLIDFYKNLGLLFEIDASTNPEDMLRQVRNLDL